jgi:hypothetical protein
MVKGIFIFMVGLGSNGYLVTNAPCLNGVTITNIINSMGHPSSDSVGLLMMDDNVHIQGTNVILQVHRDNSNPAGNGLIFWVDHIVFTYDVILLLS